MTTYGGWSADTWDSDHCPLCGEEWKDCPDPGQYVDSEPAEAPHQDGQEPRERVQRDEGFPAVPVHLR